MLQEMTCIAGIIYGLVYIDTWPHLSYACLIAYFIFPFINETILILKGIIKRKDVRQASFCERQGFKNFVPIVYSTRYNIEACGLEKMHPFDSTKYRRVWDDLVSSGVLDPKRKRFHSPKVPPREFLQFVMSKWYLFKLNFTIPIC